MKPLKIGLLDFGEVSHNLSVTNVIHNTITLIQKAEKYEFSRYWLGEHYGNWSAWGNPTTLIPILAGMTNKIKIGVAGIVLPLNGIMRAAQDYKLLANLFPNRIELGLARGGATLGKFKYVEELISTDQFSQNFVNHFERVSKFFSVVSSEICPPAIGLIPEIWILGANSENSRQLLTQVRVNFSLSLFHRMNKPTALKIFSEIREFCAKELGTVPQLNIAVAGVCNKSENKVKTIINYGSHTSFLPNVYGSYNQMRDQIFDLIDLFKIDEIIYLDLCTSYDDRLHTCSLLKRVKSEFNENQKNE